MLGFFSRGCLAPPAPSQLTTPQGRRGSDTDPRDAVDAPGSLGESHRAPLLPLANPSSHLSPYPGPSLSFPVPFLTFSLCQTDRNITKLVFFFKVSFPSWPAAMLGGCLCQSPQGPGRGQPTHENPILQRTSPPNRPLLLLTGLSLAI